MEELSGYILEEVNGKDWFETFLPGHTQKSTRALFRKAVGDTRTRGNVDAIITKEGRERLIEWYDMPLKNADGSIEGLLAIGQDITERKRATEALREREELYRTLVTSVNEAIILQEKTGEILTWNSAAEQLFGVTAKEVLGHTETSHKWKTIREDGTEFSDSEHPSMHTLATGESCKNVVMGITSVQGTFSWVNINTNPLFRQGETKPYAVVISLLDITDRKKAEQALNEAALRWQSTFDSTQDAICVIDANQRIVTCNRMMQEIVGAQQTGDIIGWHCWEVVHKTTGPIPDCPLVRMRDSRTREQMELKIGERWFVVTADPILDETGKLVGAVHNIRDITECKRAEEALGESEERYREFFTTSRDCVFITSPDGRWIDFNDATLELFGFESREELSKASIFSLYANPEERSAFLQLIEREGYVKEYPLLLKQKDGTVIDTIITTVPIQNPDGSTKAFIGTIRDVTERKRAEEALAESESFNHNLIENLPDYIGVSAPDGKILYMNPPATNALGYTMEEMIGTSVLSYVAEECRDDVISRMAARHEGGKVPPYEIDVLSRDGRRIAVIIKGTSIQYRDTPAMLLVLTDITERKRAEEALGESEGLLKSVMELLPLGVWIQNSKGEIISGNTAGKRIWAGERYVGINQFGEYKGWGLESRKLIEPHEWAAARAIEKGETSLDEQIEIECFDSTHKVILNSALPLRGSDGGIKGAIIVNQDITERKRAEAALHKANKQLNLLSDITRHDILNQLLALRRYLELSHDVIDNPEALKEYIKKEQQVANTIDEQITFTRDYQNLGVSASAWQNVNANIKEAVDRLQMRAIHVEADPANPEVYADPLFEKVFYNLIDNALRYGGDQMKTIRVSSQESDTNLTILCEDDGVGITAEDKKKLFQKGFGKHTGLGLFLSREILAITGITITENGVPGKGARFEIVVPKGAYRLTGTGQK